MIVDFMGCCQWVIEVACKYLFADLEPKSMVTKGRERREQRRLIEEQEKAKLKKTVLSLKSSGYLHFIYLFILKICQFFLAVVCDTEGTLVS